MSLLPKLNREIRFNEDIVKVEIEQQQAVSLHSHSSIHSHSPRTTNKKDAATETDKPIVDSGGGCCGGGVGSGNGGGVDSSARRISRRYTIGSVTDDISPSPPSSLRRSKKLKRVMNLVKWKRSQSRDYAGSFSVRQEFSTRILKPNDYFFFSVFTSLFCFMPIGLIGIYFSIKSVISFHAYKFSDAIYYSNLSLKTNIVAFLIGVFFFVVSMLIYFYLMYRVVV